MHLDDKSQKNCETEHHLYRNN